MNITKFAITTILPCLAICFLPSCSKQKQIKQDIMSEKSLRAKAYTFLKKKKHDDAIETLELLVNKYPESNEISKFKLLLADLYFKQGKYSSAQTMYQHYYQCYPSEKRAEYAQYHSILSIFYQTLRTDCDQSTTQQTIDLCKLYLNKATYKKYRKDVQDIEHTCLDKIINKEVICL